jgi:hypothetical protein
VRGTVIDVNRIYAGLAAFVVLGILAWTTISDPRIRLVTLAILLMYAVKAWVRRKELMHPGKVEPFSGHEAERSEAGSPLS